MPTPAVFLDRDGTLMDDSGYTSDPAEVRLYDGVCDALAALKARGYRTVIVTNQSGIGRGFFSVEQFHAVHARFLEMLGPGLIDATYYCADHPDAATIRRKPQPGMLLEAARDHDLALPRSWLIGDRTSDLEAGERAGVQPILVRTGEGARAAVGPAVYVARDFANAASFILRDDREFQNASR